MSDPNEEQPESWKNKLPKHHRKSTSAKTVGHASSTSQSDEDEKKHVSMKDLKEFRAKTIDRIIRKKRENDAKYLKFTDEKRKEVNAFRMHWKENLKRQRLEAVITEVDRKILQNIFSIPITDMHGESLRNVLKLRKMNEEQLHYLTGDLDDIDDIVPMDNRKDSGVFTLSLKNPRRSSPGRRRSASIEFNSGRRLSIGSLYLQHICAFDLSVRSKIPEAWKPLPKLKFDVSSETESRKLNNQLQIMELLDDLLVTNPSISPNRRDSRNQITPLTQQRLPRGYMLEVFQEILNIPGKIGRTMTLDNIVNFSKSPYFKDTKNENPSISSFIDGCFLVGPDQESIINAANDRLAGVTFPTANLPSTKANKQAASSTQTKHVLLPKVLFRSEFHFPPEMLQLLPSYCFPR
jgi:ribosome biogenesis protein Nip4